MPKGKPHIYGGVGGAPPHSLPKGLSVYLIDGVSLIISDEKAALYDKEVFEICRQYLAFKTNSRQLTRTELKKAFRKIGTTAARCIKASEKGQEDIAYTWHEKLLVSLHPGQVMITDYVNKGLLCHGIRDGLPKIRAKDLPTLKVLATCMHDFINPEDALVRDESYKRLLNSLTVTQTMCRYDRDFVLSLAKIWKGVTNRSPAWRNGDLYDEATGEDKAGEESFFTNWLNELLRLMNLSEITVGRVRDILKQRT